MNAQRVIADLRELAARTSTADGAQRLAWGPVWRDARAWFKAKVAELGLEVTTDSAGNNWVTLPGASPKTVIVGSHLDSVPNGGWLDGALGTLAALEALRMYAGTTPPVTLKLVDWADEEGARFGRSLLGSAAAANSLKLEEVRELKDRNGTRLVDALAENGVALDRMLDAHGQLKAIDARAYLELHIEQGPVLESLNKPTGVVLGTFGVERNLLRFTGQAAHSGSTPIPMRRDAFLAAAQAALEFRQIALRHSKPGAGVVCTVGVVNVEPKIVTAVPGVCEISLDQRALQADVLAAMLQRCARGVRTGGWRQPRHRGVAPHLAHQPASVRSGAAASLRRGRPRGNRRRAAPAVRTAARRRRDGAAHAGGDDVRVLVERTIALQGRGHARTAARNVHPRIPAPGSENRRSRGEAMMRTVCWSLIVTVNTRPDRVGGLLSARRRPERANSSAGDCRRAAR